MPTALCPRGEFKMGDEVLADTVIETDGRTVAAVARELHDRLSADAGLSSND